jgi:hypothetical protein
LSRRPIQLARRECDGRCRAPNAILLPPDRQCRVSGATAPTRPGRRHTSARVVCSCSCRSSTATLDAILSSNATGSASALCAVNPHSAMSRRPS